MSKPILFLDLDNTLFDFDAASTEKSPSEMYAPGFFRNLKPFNGAQAFVRALFRSQQYDIYILTKPVFDSPISYTEKVEAIALHFPYLLNKIILTQDKGLVRGDILIDDSAEWKEKFQGFFYHFDYKNTCKEYKYLLKLLLKE